jgi:electron transport complex protein RnfC
VIPLKQHIGAEGELCVKVGDRVLRGQPLTRGWGRMLPVHAPTSGTVAAIARTPPPILRAGGDERDH